VDVVEKEERAEAYEDVLLSVEVVAGRVEKDEGVEKDAGSGWVSEEEE
jgi:hypothetical protein